MGTKAQRRRQRLEAIRRRSAPGAAPGTIVVDPQAAASAIRVLAYGGDDYLERELAEAADIKPLLRNRAVVWVDVDGLGDLKTLKQLGEIFGIHGLALEDVVNVHQRAKVEPYPNHLFIVARMPPTCDHAIGEQLSMFLGRRFLLTFQEGRPGDCLEPVRLRLRQGTGPFRDLGPDYLAYALIDAILDSYFPVLERLADRLEILEDEVLANPRPGSMARIHEVKRELRVLRRILWPHREMINGLIRDHGDRLAADTPVYLRDCYDHAIQLLDLVELYREMGADITDLYLSSVSNRMNDVMRFLTVVSTIFIPLSFVASVYGMNFNTEHPWNMPELNMPYGYLTVLGAMGAAGTGMVVYFWRNGWVGKDAAIPKIAGGEAAPSTPAPPVVAT